MDIETTLAERQKTHGDFRQHAIMAQTLKDTLRRGVNWDALMPEQQEALDMVMHKVGRILSGDPNTHDHWHDCIGYLRLVERELES